MDAPEPIPSESAGTPPGLTREELRVVALLALVQFVNVLDFMMVMPMGPDLGAALGIPTSKLGLVGGSYTAAASVAGLASAFVVDRLPRKPALLAVVAGLALATLAGALATGLGTLLLSRVCAGAFGGPATALSLAIVADAVPVAKRGRALGIVMGAFSVASIAGVPAGLELARLGGWRAPFIGIGLLTLLIVVAAQRVMEEPRGERARGSLSLRQLGAHLASRDSVLSLVVGACTMFANFLVVPNIASYVQRNLGYPRERIGLMYLVGGATSLVAMQLAGRAVDRFGARPVNAVGSAVAMFVVAFGFAHHLPFFHPVLIATLFMAGSSVRAISFNTLTSRVPTPSERGSFMSLQSTIQHLASASGAFVSASLLGSDPDGRLLGIERLAVLSIVVSAAVPVLVTILERRLEARVVEPAPSASAV